jgi:DNA replication protein DnaC
MDSSQTKYDCLKCKDEGYILDGWTATECTCLMKKRYQTRLKGAMIPEEFEDDTLDSYIVADPTQRILLDAAKQYLAEYDDIKDNSSNGLGFLATYGEQRLNAIRDLDKKNMIKQKHNSYGLGKTHLQVAIAKELLKQDVAVLIVSDAIIMDEMMAYKSDKENKDLYYRKFDALVNVPVLIWDDIGKSNTSEPKRTMYFNIINERYKKKKAIIFSSNEDRYTLESRIGDAAASRLFSMAKGRIYRVEGQDYRLLGKKAV